MSRETIDFNSDWRLHRGELAVPPRTIVPKVGTSGGLSDWTPGLDDGEDEGTQELTLPWEAEPSPRWEDVTLPHDWRLGEPYVGPRPPADGYPHWSQGYKATGIAYYRKVFDAPESWLDRRVRLEFDGVMRDSDTWLNGHYLGNHQSGYTGFGFDLGDLLRYGGEGKNVLLVRTDTTQAEGWWYEGGGIYRDVRLVVTDPTYVIPSGVVIVPSLQGDAGHLLVTVSIRRARRESATADVTVRVIDAQSKQVAAVRTSSVVDGYSQTDLTLSLVVEEAEVWDITNPVLYLAEVEVDTGEDRDHLAIPFGFREVKFTPTDGFHLNGRRVQIWGANLHQDFAGVGVALTHPVLEYKLERVASLGFNAIRTAHHPPSPSLLDLSDRLGLLVIDENRHLSSTAVGIGELEAMITRDRNHPSVIAWSLENEEMLEGTPTGTRILTTLHDLAKKLDPTRPTLVGGCRGFDYLPYWSVTDVVGLNYRSSAGTFEALAKANPAVPLLATEDAILTTSRGTYESDPARALVSSYQDHYPDWFEWVFALETGQRFPQAAWEFFRSHPDYAGMFVWAGMDYRGEPDPYRWPSVTSHYGVLDLAGFEKDHGGLVRSYVSEEPVLHVFPHWTWPGDDGRPIRVMGYTNLEEVAILVNGRQCDRISVTENTFETQVEYSPGILEVVGFRGGTPIKSLKIETTGAPDSVEMLPSKQELVCGSRDAVVLATSIVDSAGRRVPYSDNRVRWSVEGPGRILGVGNGDPANHEPDQSDSCRAFRGLCLVIVEALDTPGELTIGASSEGLRPTRVSLNLVSSAPA